VVRAPGLADSPLACGIAPLSEKEPAMERHTFDYLTRLFATTRDRRSTLRLAATAALLGGAATLDGVAAKSRKRGKVRGQAAVHCVSTICHPGIGCPGTTLGPGTNLSRCEFIGQSFPNVNLRGANIAQAVFLGSSFFNQPSFRSVNATGTCFASATIDAADFRGANLNGADFFDADVRNADFRGANVSGAVFFTANLNGSNFQGSNITAEQLACANVGCTTILPNGKPAVTCAAGQSCDTDFGLCTCEQDSDCTVTGPNCTPSCLNGLCICE
jgi:uncharacterized protein YjbI with pentapeptide repeats